MAKAANGNGASRLGLWLSIGVSAVVLVSGAVTIFYSLSTMANEVHGHSVVIAERAITIKQLQDDNHALELEVNSLKIELNEIETQFCGEDIVRNLMHANDMRIDSVLWRKVFPEAPLPTDNSYYPTICNRKSQ